MTLTYANAVQIATEKARWHVGHHNWDRMDESEKNRYTQPYLQQAIDLLDEAARKRTK
ncbi:MAG TPA: hypothetical protein VK054_09715 [Beutenbergiaceae bacterium]|nr:hypothetical protein [Beutenbergiaceae bacterium]